MRPHLGRTPTLAAALAALVACAAGGDTPTGPATPPTTGGVPGSPAPSTPAPSTPAPSTPAPSTPAPSTPAPSTPAPGPTAYAVTGRVTNADGAPIAGATVVANNQFSYSASVSGTSAADGTYRLTLSDFPGTWGASASIQRTFEGSTYYVTLAPDDAGPFAAARGAVRNFVWRTHGPRPDGGWYGKPVVAYPALEEGNFDMVMTDVELTLTPVAMLDGTAGRVITGRLTADAEGDAVLDVPVGRYTITARELRAGEAPRPLQLRWRNEGAYAAAFTTGFKTRYLDNALIELQVRR